MFSGKLLATPQTPYRSEPDELVTIRHLSLLPVFDNLQGIYSRPVESHLREILKSNHRFEYLEAATTGPIRTPEDLEDSKDLVKEISAGLKSDAFLATRVTKGPGGISIKMNLFLKKDHSLLAQEEVTGLQSLDVDSVQKASENLLKKVMRHIPYEGVILSRQGNRVTLNLGLRDGVKGGDVVSVIQIIKLNRHPRFEFLVGSEKEILGRVRLNKVENTLSFGRIVTEKEPGAIQVNAKVSGISPVSYADAGEWSDESVNVYDDLMQRPDSQLSFGERPREWIPKNRPTFGAIGAHLGLGRYSSNIKTGSETVNTKTDLAYPFITLHGELWITPTWSVHTLLRQGIISTDNPGASGDLSHALSSYELLFGYNLRLGGGTWAPKVEFFGGYSTYRLTVDKTDSNLFTTKTYQGPKIGVSGYYPLSPESRHSVGASLSMFLSPKLKESPTAASSSKNDVKQFGIFIDRQMQVNLNARLGLDFELYSSDLVGGQADSSSQRHTTTSLGLQYLF